MSFAMRVPLKEILESVVSLQHLASLPVPSNIRFRLQTILRAVQQATADYDATRKELCEKHGDLSQDGKEYKIREEEKEAFQAELNKILAEPVEIPAPPITSSEVDKLELSAAHGLALSWLLVE